MDNSTKHMPDYKAQLTEARAMKFTEILSEPLTVGSYVVFTAEPDKNLPWFSINIGGQVKESSDADISLQFNVQMPERQVVRNSRKHGTWGRAETNGLGPFPFEVGRQFVIELLIEDKKTSISVDGVAYCSYEHRKPSPLIASWVQVTGVMYAFLKIPKTNLYQPLKPSSQNTTAKIELDKTSSIYFMKFLTRPLAVGSYIAVRGTPIKDFPRIKLNIGGPIQPALYTDISVHFNMRMPEQIVVRNTKINDVWQSGQRELSRPFPFEVGRPFLVEAEIEQDKVLFSVDGEHLCTYDYDKLSPLVAGWVLVSGVKDAILTIRNP